MLTIMCGLPGSGKSTYAQKLPGKYVSTDAIREFVTGSATCREHDRLVFTLAREMVKYYLKGGEDVVFDATNLTCSERRRVASLGLRPSRAGGLAGLPVRKSPWSATAVGKDKSRKKLSDRWPPAFNRLPRKKDLPSSALK